MKRFILLLMILLISTIAFASVKPIKIKIDTPAVDSVAPDFSLISNEGKKTSLRKFRGKWVVLYFYPKAFTSGCTIQARNFQRDLAKYEKMKAVILGVSVDSSETNKEFCAKEGLSFKLLSDVDAVVSTKYGSLMERNGTKFSARNTFIINPKGKVVKVFTGVKPNGNSEEVLSALAILQRPVNKNK
jgi:peroxiredoxin Q/BCP